MPLSRRAVAALAAQAVLVALAVGVIGEGGLVREVVASRTPFATQLAELFALLPGMIAWGIPFGAVFAVVRLDRETLRRPALTAWGVALASAVLVATLLYGVVPEWNQHFLELSSKARTAPGEAPRLAPPHPGDRIGYLAHESTAGELWRRLGMDDQYESRAAARELVGRTAVIVFAFTLPLFIPRLLRSVRRFRATLLVVGAALLEFAVRSSVGALGYWTTGLWSSIFVFALISWLFGTPGNRPALRRDDFRPSFEVSLDTDNRRSSQLPATIGISRPHTFGLARVSSARWRKWHNERMVPVLIRRDYSIIAFIYVMSIVPLAFGILVLHQLFLARGSSERSANESIATVIAAILTVLPLRQVLVPAELSGMTRVDLILGFGVSVVLGLAFVRYAVDVLRASRKALVASPGWRRASAPLETVQT